MTDKKDPAEKKEGVGSVAIAAILAGQNNEEALATVKEKFPEAKTSVASINWYRNKLRSDGENVKTARELKKEAAAETPEKAPEEVDPLA